MVEVSVVNVFEVVESGRRFSGAIIEVEPGEPVAPHSRSGGFRGDDAAVGNQQYAGG